MFKTGDRIVCVHPHGCLTQNKVYNLLEFDSHIIFLFDDLGRYQGFDMWRFNSLTLYRRKKLEKICSKLAI